MVFERRHQHSVFGKVIGNGMSVVNRIVKGDKIKTVKIERVGDKAKTFKVFT